jgi:hypothetical protein
MRQTLGKTCGLPLPGQISITFSENIF